LVFWIDSRFGEVTKHEGFVALKILFLRYMENVFVFKKVNGLIFKPDKSACKACTFETISKAWHTEFLSATKDHSLINIAFITLFVFSRPWNSTYVQLRNFGFLIHFNKSANLLL